jgi:hypothetical protein
MTPASRRCTWATTGRRCWHDSAAAGRGPERRLRRSCGLAGREPGPSEGETLALLGRNGTGKTTLINTLAGATRQHAGRITLAGQALHTLASHERAAAGIGWVPQERNIFKSLTVHENLTAVQRPGRAGHAADPGRRSGCTNCSRGWPSARATWARSYPAASSRCWPWPGPWCSTPDCCCWTSRWRAWRPSSWRSCSSRDCAHHPRRRAVGHHRRAASTGHSGHQPPRRGAGPRQRGPHRPCQ